MTNAFFLVSSEAQKNPLLPADYDILWSAIIFLIILVAFWKVFLPKMQKMLDERANSIEGNIARAEEAQAKAEAVLNEYTSQLAEARREAGEIREAAQADAQKIVAKAREDALQEQSRILQAATAQLEAERQAAIVSLRKEVGVLALDLASGVVAESLADDARAQAQLDRLLKELEAQN